MRMRKKKNLDNRLEQVGDYLLICRPESLDHRDAAQVQHLLDYAQLFGNQNPVYLEIGCGKGGFGCAFAQKHPEWNILCVEKTRNVLVQACETAQAQQLSNIFFLCCAAEYLPAYLPEQSIAGIYLNFSCPFPKKKYAAHRLTHSRFLEIYKRVLMPGAHICQKTDNMHFFEFSIENLSEAGFTVSNVSLNLHASSYMEENIMTEYEAKFSAQGMPIYRLEAYLK